MLNIRLFYILTLNIEALLIIIFFTEQTKNLLMGKSLSNSTFATEMTTPLRR